MVQDGVGTQYILSNNHVLADQNQAKSGQLILQPGLADLECFQASNDAVATFSNAVKLKFGGSKNTVDAAIAQVEPGMVDPQIMFIGDISSTPATPVPGLPVQKMGRTSCLTVGVIQGFYGNIKVNYSDTNRPKLATFTDQIVIVGGGTGAKQFAGPGDSGSLIVTQGTCPQPVALLFAGSANGSFTYANPLSEVLSQLKVSMVGTCSIAATAQPDLSGAIGLSNDAALAAKSLRDRHENELMNVPGAVGTAIGADESGQPVIYVYLDQRAPQATSTAPTEVEGTPVKLVNTGGGIIAY